MLCAPDLVNQSFAGRKVPYTVTYPRISRPVLLIREWSWICLSEVALTLEVQRLRFGGT